MKNSLKLLHIVAWLEGISYLLLFALTMPLKYYYALDWPNKIVGMAHGVLFLSYIALVYIVSTDYFLSRKELFLSYIASVLPFGTFYVDKKVFVQLKDIQRKKEE